MLYKDFTEINLDSLVQNNAIDPIQYQYFKNLEKRKIIINGEIGDDLIEYAILPLMEMDDDSGKPIEIILSTCGGSVYHGFALCDIIEKIKTPLTIRLIGNALSMGILLAIAGKNNPNVKCVCYPFTTGLLHSGSVYIGAMNSNAAKDLHRFNERYDKRIKDYIISHSKITEEMYDKIERQEFWLTSDDMLEWGIVDEII